MLLLSLHTLLQSIKSQGSDFDTVFVVLPKTGRILSRELIYTALTRAKKRVVLLVQDSIGWLREFTKPQASVLARRNTNLFDYSVRAERLNIPYVEGLIHGTARKVCLCVASQKL